MEHIETLAEAIVSARDFCGNEREALYDSASDLGIKVTKEIRAAAFAEANKIWSENQRAAGVRNPISFDERISINKAMK